MDTRKSPSSPPRTVAPLHRRARDSRIRAADVMVEMLLQAGVDTVFGIPGGSIAPLYDALADTPDIRMVTTRHETSAVFAAAAYAQTTGRLGVVLVTSGPGILNALNGIGSAHSDSLPVLVIAGEAAQEGFGRGAIQEGSTYGLNVVAMASHITKWAFELTQAESAPAMLMKAMGAAMLDRKGPVLMSAPLNTLSGRIARPSLSLDTRSELEISTSQIEAASRALASDERKVILAGSGARSAAAQLRALAEHLCCPVITTPKAKGVFPESHPLALGVFGLGGHPSAAAYLNRGVDVAMVVGSSLNEIATDGWNPNLAASRTLIHVDVDPAVFGRVYPADIGIAAPAKAALEALIRYTPAKRAQDEFGGVTFAYDVSTLEVISGEGVAAPSALYELQEHLPDDAIYTTDSGNNLFYAIHYLRIDCPDAFLGFLGLASMGTSLPAALGAQLAAPDRKVVAILGDGGLGMVAGELSTIASLRLPIVVAVLNDRRYGMVEFGMQKIFNRTPSFEMSPFDVVGVGASCGARAHRIEKLDDIGPALRDAPPDRPLVLDIAVEPHVGLPTNMRFQQISKNVQRAEN